VPRSSAASNGALFAAPPGLFAFSVVWWCCNSRLAAEPGAGN
jgi:hypothetical protein